MMILLAWVFFLMSTVSCLIPKAAYRPILLRLVTVKKLREYDC